MDAILLSCHSFFWFPWWPSCWPWSTVKSRSSLSRLRCQYCFLERQAASLFVWMCTECCFCRSMVHPVRTILPVIVRYNHLSQVSCKWKWQWICNFSFFGLAFSQEFLINISKTDSCQRSERNKHNRWYFSFQFRDNLKYLQPWWNIISYHLVLAQL